MCSHKDADPLPLITVKAGRNHLNEQNTPLFPIVIGRVNSQTIKCQAALLCRL